MSAEYINRKFGYIDTDNISNQTKEVRDYLGNQLTNIIYEDIKTSVEYRVILKLEPVKSISIICKIIEDISKSNNINPIKITDAINETFKDLWKEGAFDERD